MKRNCLIVRESNRKLCHLPPSVSIFNHPNSCANRLIEKEPKEGGREPVEKRKKNCENVVDASGGFLRDGFLRRRQPTWVESRERRRVKNNIDCIVVQGRLRLSVCGARASFSLSYRRLIPSCLLLWLGSLLASEEREPKCRRKKFVSTWRIERNQLRFRHAVSKNWRRNRVAHKNRKKLI